MTVTRHRITEPGVVSYDGRETVLGLSSPLCHTKEAGDVVFYKIVV